ncbi:hypothetical protein QR680_015501 [Steinernema hermaphroditum]|uniref:TIL domain-containing protein n=1 Tax=Steinernema hermaphroditum TaxID=289476 RepID=A0AA39H9U4_9BILA|nr:hypothetical protein QR680_015501 [Steinernema hermaphroditum]
MKSFYIVVVCCALVHFSEAYVFADNKCEAHEIYYNGTGFICHATCDEPSHDRCNRFGQSKGCYYCPPEGECPKNEEYLDNGCTSFCGGPAVTKCAGQNGYFPGCYCVAPYSRDSRGRCIKRSECPKTNSSIKTTRAPRRTPAPSSKCGTHAFYYNGTYFADFCSATCEYPDHDWCPRTHISAGCYCKPPYVKLGGKCIAPENCPPE